MNKKQIIGFSILISMIFILIQGNIIHDNQNDPTIKKDDINIVDSSDISVNDKFSGVGQAITANETAHTTNSSITIPEFSSDGYSLGYIDTPPQWTGYSLFTNVTSIYDNANWEINGTMDVQDPWVYSESDVDDLGGTHPYENCWGSWESSGNSPIGTETGTLFLHQGYLAEGPLAGDRDRVLSTDHATFTEQVYIDRQDVTDAKLSFYYWANSSNHGVCYLYADINGYQKSYFIYELGQTHETWVYTEFTIPILEISNYITGTENIDIKIGLKASLNDLYIEELDGYVYQEAYIDNVTLAIRGKAKPSQIQLKVNDSSVIDTNFGQGNVNLSGNWNNPSNLDFKPTICNFTTGNSSGVDITVDITQYASRIKISQDSNGDPNTEFFVSHNNDVNWTAYYYGLNPDRYEDYNFTLNFPSDWDVWAVYDPTPSEILSSLDEGISYLGVSSTYASALSGIWRIEFSAPNYVTDIRLFKNTTNTPSPTDWIESTEIYAGDYLNVTAEIDFNGIVSNLVDTSATLTIKLPDGTIWSDQTQVKTVSSNLNGLVYFDPILLPTEEPNYEVGDYKVFVTWNNSYSNYGLNETGIFNKTIKVSHYSKLTPEKLIFSNFIEGTTRVIKINFNDLGNNDAIQNALLYFTNLTGQQQIMSEISPGQYYAEIKAPNTNPGTNIVTIYANHTDYENISIQLTFEVYIKTKLTAEEYPAVSLTWNENVTINLNYTELTSKNGISFANIQNDWSGENWLEEGIPGIYTLTLNTSSYSPNSVNQIEIYINEFGYVATNILIEITINQRDAGVTLFLNKIDKTVEKSVQALYQNSINVSIDYYDVLNGSTNKYATAILQGVPTGDIPFDFIAEIYQCSLDTTDLGVGVHSLTIVVNSTNNIQKSILITVTVTPRTTNYKLYLNDFDRTLEKSLQIYAITTLNVSVNYFDLGTSSKINPATIKLQGLSSGEKTLSNIGGVYYIILDINEFSVGEHSLTIIANATNYIQQSFLFKITVQSRLSAYQLLLDNEDKTLEKSAEAPYQYSINISVNFYDGLNGSTVLGSNIILQGLLSGDKTLNYDQGIYQYILYTSDLSIGVHSFSITASADRYLSKSFSITIVVTERPTDYRLYLNENNKTISKSINVQIQTILNISVDFLDVLSGYSTLSDADVIISDFGLGDISMTESNGLYYYPLDTSAFSLGIHFFVITASIDNHTQQSFQFIVTIEKRNSDFTLYLNQIDKTLTKNLQIPLRANFNISVNYFDVLGSYTINPASLVLIGVEDSDIPFSFTNGIYQLMVNSSELGLGTHYITISGTSSMNKQKSLLIVIKVTKIPTKIETKTAEETLNFNIKDDSILLEIKLTDLLFDSSIYGANVTYSWVFGTGALTDDDNDGIYSVNIDNPGEGTFTIRINVYKGNEYDFQAFDITVNIIDDSEPIPESTLYILLFLMLAIIGSFIAYQTHFKYPKTIRSIRKVNKSIKKREEIDTGLKPINKAYFDGYSKILKKEFPKIVIKPFEEVIIERDTSEIEKELGKKPTDEKVKDIEEEEQKDKKFIKKLKDLEESQEKMKKIKETEEKTKMTTETQIPKPEIPVPDTPTPSILDVLKKEEEEKIAKGIKKPEVKDLSGFEKPSVKKLSKSSKPTVKSLPKISKLPEKKKKSTKKSTKKSSKKSTKS